MSSIADEKPLPPPPPKFSFFTLPSLPKHLPLSKERTYFGLRRNTFLLVLLGAFLALLALILGLAIGLTVGKKSYVPPLLPTSLFRETLAPFLIFQAHHPAGRKPTFPIRPTRRSRAGKARTTAPVSARAESTPRPPTPSSPSRGGCSTRCRSARIPTRTRCAG